MDERTIRRRCGEQWLARGLARLDRPADSRAKPQWYVREDADPLLARVLFPDQRASDLRHLDADQRKRVQCKAAVLAAFDRFAAGGHGLTQRAVDAHSLRLLVDGRAGVSLAPGVKVPTDRCGTGGRRSAGTGRPG